MKNAFSKWDANSTEREAKSSRNVELVTASSWETRRPRKSDSSWDKRRLSNQLLTSFVSRKDFEMPCAGCVIVMYENILRYIEENYFLENTLNPYKVITLLYKQYFLFIYPYTPH